MNSIENTRHLLSRAGFGTALTETGKSMTVDRFVAHASANKSINIVDKAVLEADKKDQISKKQIFQKSRKQVLELNGAWIAQLSDPKTRFREKMTLFWHDHFACRIRAPFLAQQQNNILRENALGKFGDLLMSVSKDAGMLQFLNNQQNKKNSPNENFAREVLELFTLGRGHYSEDDIKNAARAFTGWAFNPVTGKFLFREKSHDVGVKSFKGRRGNLSGEDIISITLDDQQTAKFITRKLWDYFVSPSVADKDVIDSLSTSFYDSGYDLMKLMKEMLSSESFYDPRVVSNRIKSPVELIAGMMTHIGGQFENLQTPLFVQRALSQILFYPPNVGGWPTGTSWIDSSSLAFRMSLPNVLLKSGATNIEAKDDGDVNNVTNIAASKTLSIKVDWSELAHQFMRGNTTETLDNIEFHLLAGSLSTMNKGIVKKYAASANDDHEFFKRAFISIMSMPEYQLS